MDPKLRNTLLNWIGFVPSGVLTEINKVNECIVYIHDNIIILSDPNVLPARSEVRSE